MTAVVAGASLGLLNSSLAVLGTGGVLGQSAHGQSGERVYVNAATGNLVLQRQDEILVGTGIDAALVRTYNSRGATDGDNNDGWRLGVYKKVYNLTGSVNSALSTITRIAGDGSESVYTYDVASGKYQSSDGEGAKDTLAYVANTWTWTDGGTQAQEKYDGANGGRITQTLDPDGNALTYTYNGAGLITQVTDASGETTYLDYTGTNLTQLRTVKSGGATVTRVRYGYDGSNRLTSVTVDLSPDDNLVADANTYVSAYTYDGTSKRVASLTQSDGTSLTFAYTEVATGDWRVSSITDALGRVTSVSYNTATRTTTVTQPLNRTTSMVYDTAGQLTSITGPLVSGASQVVSFAYDASGNVTQTTDAKGNAVVYQYDANGNRTLERDAAGNTVTRVYSAANQLTNETVYLVPDPDGAGAGQAGAPLTTRYAYDSEQHLRFAVSAEGRVTEHRYNAAGQRVATLTYTGNAYSLAGLGTTDALSESTLNTWAGGAAVDKTKAQRVDYAYDFRGQLNRATSYEKVDASGNGLAAGKADTDYIYDQAGGLLKTIDPRGVATTGDPNDFTTSYVYDGLGRLVSTTDSLGRLTLSQYDAANRKITVTLANGLVRTSTYTTAGELVSVLESAGGPTLGETKYFYDLAGRLRRTEDPTGIKTHFLYDDAGRKVAEIDGDGSLIEYRYDANNNLTRTIRYATAVSSANLASLIGAGGAPTAVTLASIRPAANAAADRSAWNAYDAANRLAKSVDELGFVTQYFYDGADQPASELRSAIAIATTGLGDAPSPGAIAPFASVFDRVTRAFYDADGKARGALDSEGYLTENLYDAAGRLVETVRYATPTTAALRATGTLAQLRPSAAAGDIHAYTLYNARGEVAGQVDGEGYLTELVYDAAGNQKQQTRYATKVTYTAGATLDALRPAGTAQDQLHARTYDALNRVATETAPDTVVTQYTYDEVGNLTKTVKAFNVPAEARTLSARYDKQGRLTAELSGVGNGRIADGQPVEQTWSDYGIDHAYDAAGRKVSTTDASGNKTLFFYDADGRLAYTVNALGEVKGATYNALGQLVQSRQYAGRLTGFGSWTGGLVDSTVANAVMALASPALDSVVTYTYALTGDLLQTVDSLGNAETATYNAFGEALVTTQGGVETRSQVDRRGLVASVSVDPHGLALKTAYTYDAYGRKLSMTEGVGSAQQRVTLYEYDRLGRQTKQTVDFGTGTHLNLVTSHTYDKNGNVVTATNANNKVTRYVYDAADRLVYTIAPIGTTGTLASVTRNEYDANGRVFRVTSYATPFDTAGLPAIPAPANVSVASDSARDRVATYGYDRDGREILCTDAVGTVTAKVYDPDGRLIRSTTLGEVTRYVYDGAGRLAYSIGAADVNAKHAVIASEYDGKGNLVRVTAFAKGISNTTDLGAAQVAALLDPDPLDRVTRHVFDAANREVFTLDAGNYVKETRYDDLGRITQTVQYSGTINVGDFPTAAQVRTALAIASSASYTNNITPPNAAPVQPNPYLASARNDTTAAATQAVSVTAQSATVSNGLIQPYAFVGSAKADSATPATQAVSLSVQNTSITQSANVLTNAWYRSGSSLVTGAGLSIAAGYVGHTDNTPTGVRATLYKNGVNQGQVTTDVGYSTTESWSVANAWDEYGNPTSYRTAYGTRWNNVSGWTGQVNIATGTLTPGTYSIVLEAWDSAQTGQAENAFYDYTDATWSFSNTINVNVGLQVQPTYVRWATSTQPADTTAVTLKFRTAGSTGAYSSATVGVNGANHEANLGAIAAGNYEYVIEYRDTYGRLLKSASGTLTSTDAQTTSASATFNYTTYASSAAAGTSIRFFTQASQWAPVERIVATVKDAAGNVVSTATTWPEAEAGYNGEVNLKVGAALAEGSYRVELTLYNKSGSSTVVAPFCYELGPAGQPLNQAYAYSATARLDAPTPAAVTIAVSNATEFQSASIANVGWTRSGNTMVSGAGLSVVTGTAGGNDLTPTQVRATLYQGTTQVGQVYTDVGYQSTDSWSVANAWDEYGNPTSYRTAYGTRWNAVSNWNRQANLTTGLAPGHYKVVIETRDDAQAGQAENAFYDFTDSTWTNTTTLNDVVIGTIVQPTVLSWAAATQPAGTASVSLSYRAAGSSGAYSGVAVTTNGANQQASIAGLTNGNYEYLIEYRNAGGQVIKYSTGSFASTQGGSSSVGATFTALASSSAAGSSIRYFTQAAQWAPVERVSATVRDQFGNVVSTAATYPDAEANYYGEVNLKTGGALADGHYTIELTIYNKNGTSSAVAPFGYDVGSQLRIQQTVTWAASTQPAGTTALIKYRPQGSTGSFATGAVTTAGANQQAVLDFMPAGNYEYVIEYRDSYNVLRKSAGGTFTVAPSGSATTSISFSYTTYSSTATTGSSITGYIAAAQVPTIERVEAVVNDYVTGTTISSATTYPEYEPGYVGNVNLSVGAPLQDGRYNVTVTVFKKDGTSSASTFLYEVGQQPYARRTTTVAWSTSTQPASTSVEFAYVRAGQSGETVVTPTLVGGEYQVALVRNSDDGVQAGDADGIYDFTIRYKQGATVVKQARGQVLAQASGDGQVTLSFTGSAPAQERVNSFAYDRAGRLIQSTDPLGFSESFGYDALGNKTSFTNKKGAVWTYAYDSAGRMTDEFSPAVTLTSTSGTVTNNVALQTRMEYDALGNVTARTEAFGRDEARKTRYEYDAAGNQVRIIFPSVFYYDASKDSLAPAASNAINRTAFETLADTDDVNKRLFSEVTYNALGNAVVNRAADGTYSYKVYDKGGRLRYDIDAERYVTEHGYDAFGNETALIRYANRLNFTPSSTAFTLAQVAGLLPAQPDAALDRKVEKVYDNRNLLIEVKEPRAYAYDAAANSGAVTARSTVTEYNRFGEAVHQSIQNADTDVSLADTYWYYDGRGKRTAQVDAEGFLTTWEYDAAGNTTKATEFARAVPAGTSTAGYFAPVMGDENTGYDRATAYAYDLADRKITETVLGARYHRVTLTDQNALENQSGDLTTTFGYDAAGNMVSATDASGATSYIYYDALGRTYATTAPARMTAEGNRGGQSITPLSVYGLDAFAKTVRQTDFANGATSANATTFTAGVASSADQVSSILYDKHGHALQTTDAEGRSKYFSYDMAGRIAKSWQPVTQSWPGYVTPATQYSVQAFKYDALGNQTATIDASTRWDYADGANLVQGGAGQPVGSLVTLGASYWAEPVSQEWGTTYIDHWQPSNNIALNWGQNLASMGSGEVQVRLGYSYATGGSTERVFSFASASATTGVNLSWGDAHWTTSYGVSGVNYIQVYKKNAANEWVLVHDTNGPLRGYSDAAYPAATNYGFNLGASIAQSAVYWQTPEYGEWGFTGYADHFQPSNTVNAGWGTNLAALGSGAVQIVLSYNYASGGSTERTFNLAGTTGTSASLSWSDSHWTSPYGVASVSRLRVYKANAAGTMVLLQDTNANGWSSTMVGWQTTAAATDPVSLAYRTTPAGTWSTATATNFGAVTLVDLRSASAVELEMRRTAANEPVYAYQRGAAAGGGFTGAVILNQQGATYNAFGEIVAKDVNGRATEYFDYDAAGHLWRTNQKDGVNKIYLYDVQGKATAEIRSRDADLHTATYGSAALADIPTRNPNVAVRTETQYDRLGRVVGRELAAFGSVDPAVVSAPAPGANSAWASFSTGGGYFGEYGYGGVNYVYAGWTSLAGWGSGILTVSVDVVTMYSGTVTVETTVDAAQAGATMAVYDEPVSIARVRVWKRDGVNSQVLVRDSATAATRQLTFASPILQQTDYAVFSYRPTGGSTWSTLTVQDFGAVSMVDTAGWANGSYNYKIEYKTAAGAIYATGNGTLNVAGGTVAVTPASAETQNVTPLFQQSVDRWGNTLSVVDARRRTDAVENWETKYQYDGGNRLLAETGPLVAMKKENGDLAYIRPTTRNFYDMVGRAIGVQDPNAVLADTDNDGKFEYANTARYNAAGQVIRQVHADGGAVDYKYDVFGRQVENWDARDKKTTYAYDRMNRLTQLTRPDNAVELFEYDEVGDRVRERDGRGYWTSYAYDAKGRVIRATAPNGQSTLTYYDDLGNKTREINANGQVQSWDYKADSFGRESTYSDLANVVTTYDYNKLGQVKTANSSRAQNAYTYDINGALKLVQNNTSNPAGAVAQTTEYQYDAVGNRTREIFKRGGVTYQDSAVAYDALNRVTGVTDARFTLSYWYDANGNRREAKTDFYNNLGQLTHKEYWYKYDRMNRIVLTQGVLSSGNIVVGSQGTALSYDLAGNRTLAQGASTGGAAETYLYDSKGQLIETRRNGYTSSYRVYDAAGNVTQTNTYNSSGTLTGYQINSYDANGWLTQQNNYKRLYHTDAAGTPFVFDGINSQVNYTGRNGLGQVTSYNVVVWNPHIVDSSWSSEWGFSSNVWLNNPHSYTNWYSTSYVAYGSASKEANVHGSSTYWLQGDTATRYDGNGNIYDVTDTFAASNYRSFITDTSGRILQKIQGGQNEYYFYGNDKPLGATGANGAADFDFNYTPVSDDYPSQSPSNWVVGANDTLQSIAQAAYGDAGLWYLIADANGITGGVALKVGMTLTIPNKISNLHNTFETFKPYDPSKIIGDTTPTLPDPPPPPQSGGDGCGILGTIIVMIVVIIVAYFTEQWWLVEYGAEYTAGTAAAAAEGATVLSAETVAAMVGAAAGSVAGQVVGNIIGVQHGFNFASFAASVLSAGVGSAAGAAATEAGATVAQAAVMRAVASNLASQGVNIVLGEQHKFNWASLAASAVTAGLSAEMADKTSDLYVSNAVARNVIGSAAGGVVRAVLSGGKLDARQIAADAFGNAAGSWLGREIWASYQTQVAERELQAREDARDKAMWNLVGGNAPAPRRESGAPLGADSPYAEKQQLAFLGNKNRYTDGWSTAPSTEFEKVTGLPMPEQFSGLRYHVFASQYPSTVYVPQLDGLSTIQQGFLRDLFVEAEERRHTIEGNIGRYRFESLFSGTGAIDVDLTSMRIPSMGELDPASLAGGMIQRGPDKYLGYGPYTEFSDFHPRMLGRLAGFDITIGARFAFGLGGPDNGSVAITNEGIHPSTGLPFFKLSVVDSTGAPDGTTGSHVVSGARYIWFEHHPEGGYMMHNLGASRLLTGGSLLGDGVTFMGSAYSRESGGAQNANWRTFAEGVGARVQANGGSTESTFRMQIWKMDYNGLNQQPSAARPQFFRFPVNYKH